MDINKPANDRISHSDNAEQIPKINTTNSNTGKRISSKSKYRYKENMSYKSIVFQRVVVSYKLFVLVANLRAFTGRVAVGDAWEVDIGIDVSSHQVEDVFEAVTGFLAELSATITAGVSVTGEKLYKKGWNLEEGIQEWTSSNATPIFSDQSLKRRVPMCISAPVPAHNHSRNAIIDYITENLQVSLKNWSPQTNSIKFSQQSSPELVKLKKLLEDGCLLANAACWNKKRATSPIVKMMKRGM